MLGRKKERGEGEGRKKCACPKSLFFWGNFERWQTEPRIGVFSSLSPPPTPLLLTRPIFSSLFEFQHGAFASKVICTPEQNACRLGIFGMEYLNKIHCGIRKNAKYLVRKRDLTATGEAGFTKIWTRDAGIFLPVCREFEECGNCESTRREISGVSSAVLSPASFLPLFPPASSD